MSVRNEPLHISARQLLPKKQKNFNIIIHDTETLTLSNEQLKYYKNYQKHSEDRQLSAETFLFIILLLQIILYILHKKYPNKVREFGFTLLVLYSLTLLYHYEVMNLYSFGFILVWILWGIYTSYLMYLLWDFPKAFKS